MGLTFVDVSLTALGKVPAAFAASFLVNTEATDSLAPASALRHAGIEPVGRSSHQLAHGLTRLPAIPMYEFVESGF